MLELSATDLLVRHAVYASFAAGAVPTVTAVGDTLRINIGDVRHAYEHLAAAHALVLDPRTGEVWMALPFSAVPTDFRVTSGDTSWFANCAWDAFGIPALLGRDALITAVCRDCGDPLTYRIQDGRMSGSGGMVHFGVRASQWWDDIGFT